MQKYETAMDVYTDVHGLALNAAVFERRKFSILYVSQSKNKPTLLSLIKSITYFQFQFPLFSAFVACLTELELLTSGSSIRNLRQRVTLQRTVDANELCTKALPGSH